MPASGASWPFRYIDTHAGSGIYDLAGDKAEKTDEWRAGILRLLSSPMAGEAQALMKSYLDCVRPLVAAVAPRYPGSPLIAAALLRPQDKMIACELHPETFLRLKANMWSDRRAKAIEIDGYAALKAD